MKLTSASSYALHAVALMAGRKDADPVASHEIAKARRIPEKFLLKVLTPLVRARRAWLAHGAHRRLPAGPAGVADLAAGGDRGGGRPDPRLRPAGRRGRQQARPPPPGHLQRRRRAAPPPAGEGPRLRAGEQTRP